MLSPPVIGPFAGRGDCSSNTFFGNSASLGLTISQSGWPTVCLVGVEYSLVVEQRRLGMKLAMKVGPTGPTSSVSLPSLEPPFSSIAVPTLGKRGLWARLDSKRYKSVSGLVARDEYKGKAGHYPTVDSHSERLFCLECSVDPVRWALLD